MSTRGTLGVNPPAEIGNRSELLDPELVPGVFLLVDTEGRMHAWNSRLEELVGLDARRIGSASVLDLLDPSDHFRAICSMRECMKAGVAATDVTLRTAEGVVVPIYVRLRRTEREGQDMIACVGLDISSLKAVEAEHVRQRVRLERLASHVPGVVFQLQRDVDTGRFWLPYASAKFTDVFGASFAEICTDAKQLFDSIDTGDYGRVLRSVERSARMLTPLFEHFRYYPPDKPRSKQHMEWLELDCGPEKLADGSVIWHGFARRVTHRRKLERKLTRLAYYDSLTGLPNRAHMQSTLRDELRMAVRAGQGLAVLYLDLDNFNDINDAWSHAAGDRLLLVIADRLRKVLGEDGLLGRVGGDEFLILLRALVVADRAEALAKEISKVMAEPVQLGAREVRVTVSIGISLFPDDAEQSQDLIRHADAAVYLAKSYGVGRWARYTSELTDAARARRYLETELRTAIERNEIQVSLQPIVSLIDGLPVTEEALARWYHWEDGWLAPDRFVALAEKRGLASALGEQVYRRAMRAVVAVDPNARLAVNVAPSQLQNPKFCERLLRIGAEEGLGPECIEVEITERAFLNDTSDTIEQINQLRRAGISVTIDDFGTGYSSLSYLHRLPVQRLKIDRSFVHRIDKNHANAAIVRAIVGLAHDLDMEVIAEGVETAAEAETVRRLRCDYAQGWFYGRPVLVE